MSSSSLEGHWLSRAAQYRAPSRTLSLLREATSFEQAGAFELSCTEMGVSEAG